MNREVRVAEDSDQFSDNGQAVTGEDGGVMHRYFEISEEGRVELLESIQASFLVSEAGAEPSLDVVDLGDCQHLPPLCHLHRGDGVVEVIDRVLEHGVTDSQRLLEVGIVGFSDELIG